MFLFSDRAGPGYLVAFLGNPGTQYVGTRHNVGFQCADIAERDLQSRGNFSGITRARFRALTGLATVADKRVLLIKPQTFMNLSGEAVGQASAYYKIPLEHILILSDDISLPVGKLRFRTKGSAGGHNGLKDIIQVLGTDAFPRLRIGVGAPDHNNNLINWVLGTFPANEQPIIQDSCTRAWEAVQTWLSEGPERTMSKYN